MTLLMPEDNQQTREFWEEKTFGSCGPACIAAIIGIDVQDVLNKWLDGFKGHAPFKEVRACLEEFGFKQTVKRAKDYVFTYDQAVIARIQWVGPLGKDAGFNGWSHWTEATKNTHYIAVWGDQIFCNGNGIFPIKNLDLYLKGLDGKDAVPGRITSIIEVHGVEE